MTDEPASVEWIRARLTEVWVKLGRPERLEWESALFRDRPPWPPFSDHYEGKPD